MNNYNFDQKMTVKDKLSQLLEGAHNALHYDNELWEKANSIQRYLAKTAMRFVAFSSNNEHNNDKNIAREAIGLIRLAKKYREINDKLDELIERIDALSLIAFKIDKEWFMLWELEYCKQYSFPIHRMEYQHLSKHDADELKSAYETNDYTGEYEKILGIE